MLTIKSHKNIYKAYILGTSNSNILCLGEMDHESLLWQKIFGHAIIQEIKKLTSKYSVIGLLKAKLLDEKTWNTYIRGMQLSTTKSFELIYVDTHKIIK